jgi:cell division protein FtsB
MNRTTQVNRYQNNSVRPRFTVRGVLIARLLVVFLLALNVALISTIFCSSSGLPGYRKQVRQVEEFERNVLKLRTENQKLFEMITSFKTNPQAQEKLVRRELGWVHEREVVFETTEKGSERGVKAAEPIKPFNLPK